MLHDVNNLSQTPRLHGLVMLTAAMTCRTALLSERFATDVTFERLLPSMETAVTYHNALPTKHFSTDIAPERFTVQPKMHCKTVLTSKRLLADITGEGLSACVHQTVDFQRAFLSK